MERQNLSLGSPSFTLGSPSSSLESPSSSLESPSSSLESLSFSLESLSFSLEIPSSSLESLSFSLESPSFDGDFFLWFNLQITSKCFLYLIIFCCRYQEFRQFFCYMFTSILLFIHLEPKLFIWDPVPNSYSVSNATLKIFDKFLWVLMNILDS